MGAKSEESEKQFSSATDKYREKEEEVSQQCLPLLLDNFLAVVTPIKDVRVLQRSFLRLVGLLTLQ